MIDRPSAKLQVRRLSGLDFFPADDVAVEELISAALEAENHEACRKAFDSLIYDANRCPTPGDIRRVVRIENERFKSTWANPIKPSEPLCAKCQSNGYFERPGGVFDRCDCDNGLEFSQILLDQLNQKPEPKKSSAPTEAKVQRTVRLAETLEKI
jgi:hypothetical protein